MGARGVRSYRWNFVSGILDFSVGRQNNYLLVFLPLSWFLQTGLNNVDAHGPCDLFRARGARCEELPLQFRFRNLGFQRLKKKSNLNVPPPLFVLTDRT